MQGSMGRDAILGFIAAAIAVVTVHQVIVFGLTNYGMLPPTTKAWNTAPFGPLNVPTIVNSIFWGGLWGALFGLIHSKLPGGALWVKGLIYGLIVTVISNWTLLPLIKKFVFGVAAPAQTALFSGGDPKRMLAVALILGGFGAMTGLVYGLINTKA